MKRQFISRNNKARVTTRAPYNVRRSYSGNSQSVNRYVLSMFLNVDNVGAERMSSGGLFQATGPATQNTHTSQCDAPRRLRNDPYCVG